MNNQQPKNDQVKYVIFRNHHGDIKLETHLFAQITNIYAIIMQRFIVKDTLDSILRSINSGKS